MQSFELKMSEEKTKSSQLKKAIKSYEVAFEKLKNKRNEEKKEQVVKD